MATQRRGKPAYPTHVKGGVRQHPDYSPTYYAIECRYCHVWVEVSERTFKTFRDYESHIESNHPGEPIPERSE